MKLQIIYSFLFIISCVKAEASNFGDSTSAFATQTIVHKLQIKRISDLNFGEASPGDGPKTVQAGYSENRENASFEVDGEPYRQFQVILPNRNSVKMINGSGGANREITIQSFESFPTTSGTINYDGKSMIFVGATRGAISRTQKTGEYTGQFYVTVVY